MGSAAEGEMLEVQVQRFCSPLEKKKPAGENVAFMFPADNY